MVGVAVGDHDVSQVFVSIGDPRHQLLQGAEGTDPTAEEASQHRSQCQNDQPDPGPAGYGPIRKRGIPLDGNIQK